jgi:hypothetical protein
MVSKQTKVVVAAAAVLLLLAMLIVWVSNPRVPGRDTRAPAKPQAAAKPTTSPATRVKVGVYLSHYSATGPSWIGRPYGYTSQVAQLRHLKMPELDLYPFVEPGTETDPELAKRLRSHFPGKRPLDITKAADIRTVQVLVTNHSPNVAPEALDAIETAVRDGGVHLITRATGVVTPGWNEQTTRLSGLTSCQYGWNPQPVECEVVTPHPLLGSLTAGAVIPMMPNGAYGTLPPGAIPLIRVKDMADVGAVGAQAPGGDAFIHHPLYLSRLGKGWILGCPYAPYRPTPAELDAATGGNFLKRAVIWLAQGRLE